MTICDVMLCKLACHICCKSRQGTVPWTSCKHNCIAMCVDKMTCRQVFLVLRLESDLKTAQGPTVRLAMALSIKSIMPVSPITLCTSSLAILRDTHHPSHTCTYLSLLACNFVSLWQLLDHPVLQSAPCLLTKYKALTHAAAMTEMTSSNASSQQPTPQEGDPSLGRGCKHFTGHA